MRLAPLVIVALSIASGMPRTVAAQVIAMPKLRHVFTSNSLTTSPANRLTTIAIGPQGTTFFVGTPATDGLLLTLVDSSGKVIGRFGKPGEGPGEVRTPVPVSVTRTELSIMDQPNGRYSEYDLKGGFMRSIRPSSAVGTVVTGKDLVAVKYDKNVWVPMRIDPKSGELGTLLAPADTFLTAHFGLVNGKSRPGGYATMLGNWDGGFLVGDVGAYRVALYRWDGTLVRVLGRDLPIEHASAGRTDEFIGEMKRRAGQRGGTVDEATVARMRKMAMDQPMPYLTPGSPIRTDDHHRIWMVGMEGDSAFADLFSADRFLGRLHLPCRLFNGSWSVTGSWLAITCLPDDESFDGDAVLKTFRIVEGGR